MLHQKICEDLMNIRQVTLSENPVCEKCRQMGDNWVHLRTCQTCGETHCCDSSKNKHATEHYHLSRHPVVASAEPGEYWLWCYPHAQLVKYGR
jgi:uncharacterized UBP type Zn finger protein